MADARPLSALEDRALLAEIARSLVTSPVHVRVEEEPRGDSRAVLRLYVRPEDRGSIIGRRGRTITALRQLFSAIGMKDGRHLLIELEED